MKSTLVYYKILNYTQGNLEFLNEQFDVITLSDPTDNTPQVLQQAEVILAPLGYHCGKQVIDLAPDLKIIGSNTTGHPHIDVA